MTREQAEKVAKVVLEIGASAAEDALAAGNLKEVGTLDETLTEEDLQMMRAFCFNPYPSPTIPIVEEKGDPT